MSASATGPAHRRGAARRRCLAGRLSAGAGADRGLSRAGGMDPRFRAALPRPPQRVAGAVGQPLDLGGDRGARRRRSGSRSPSCSPATTFRAGGCSGGWSRCRRCCRRWWACSPSSSCTARVASSRCWCSACSAWTEPPWRLQGAGAILLVHAYSMYVYFYLFTRAGAASRSTPRCSRRPPASGAGRWRTLRRVVLPLLYPALGGAALLTFMTALASFSAPYIFGGGFRVMTTQIVATRLNGDDRAGHGRDRLAHAARAGWRSGCSRGARTADSRRAGARAWRPRWCRCGSPAARLALAVLGWGLARCCCCRISRCCWSRSCRSGPGPPSRSRRRTPGATTSP